MKKSVATLGVVAACAVCCAPLLLPLLAGAGLVGAGAAGGGLLLGLPPDLVICGGIALAAGLQVAIGALAVLRGWGRGSENWPQPIWVLSLIFCLIWLASAACFRRAARADRAPG